MPTRPFSIDRRRFLACAGSAATIMVPSTGFAVPTVRRGAEPTRARNVIFMVSDGMSMGTLTLAHLASIRRHQKPSAWVSLWNRSGVRRATATTMSADSLVTDSAAGGSAWGSGVHINNGRINVAPDGRQLMPIQVRAAQAGKATGLVTTTKVTHATPASFIANAPLRDMEGLIAENIMDRRVDVTLGGGAKFFPDALLAKHADCKVVRNLDELNASASNPGRLLGLFAPSHVPFELDRKPGVPTLTQMTRVALDRLAKAPNGFVLQVEGGRVDHAAHNNDAPSLIAEQLAFDDAIAEVLRCVEGRDDTLLVLTTDHGNANPGLTLYGERSFTAFDRIAKATASSDAIADQLTAIKDKGERVAKAPGIIQAATGIKLDATELRLLERSLGKERVAPFAELNDPIHVMNGLLANSFGVSFVSGNHTADMVEVTAMGPGSQNLRPLIDNIELHGLMVSALDLPEAKLLDGMDAPMKALPVKKDD